MDRGKVLIVDDSSTSRMIIQRCIEMAGIAVSEYHYAENGLEAIAALKACPGIGLIVTDLNMPKMDGQTFLMMLKSEPGRASIPTIVVSSVVDGDGGREIVALGASAVIKKPVSPAKMLQAFGGLK